MKFENFKQNGMDSKEAIEAGMKDKAKEFIEQGGKFTLPDHYENFAKRRKLSKFVQTPPWLVFSKN